jgi:hypothetical protein
MDVPSWVVASWALDLFRGAMTREHEDPEIAGPAGGFSLVRAQTAGRRCGGVPDR